MLLKNKSLEGFVSEWLYFIVPAASVLSRALGLRPAPPKSNSRKLLPAIAGEIVFRSKEFPPQCLP